MANSVLVGNALEINYQVGVDSKGKDVFNKQSFKNVSVDSTDDKLVELSDAVEKLMDYTVSTIKKQQTFMLTRK